MSGAQLGVSSGLSPEQVRPEVRGFFFFSFFFFLPLSCKGKKNKQANKPLTHGLGSGSRIRCRARCAHSLVLYFFFFKNFFSSSFPSFLSPDVCPILIQAHPKPPSALFHPWTSERKKGPSPWWADPSPSQRPKGLGLWNPSPKMAGKDLLFYQTFASSVKDLRLCRP